MQKSEYLKALGKGLIVGGTMTVPGVSGGTMAMLLGIYDRLIGAVSGLFRNFLDNVMFLGCFLAGGILGIMCFAGTVLVLLERYPMPLSYFFLGAVAGGVPFMVKKAQIRTFSPGVLLWPLAGVGVIIGISALPEGLFSTGGAGGIQTVLLQLLCGIFLAVALILPGISASHMLLLLGIYEEIMASVAGMHFLSLLPLVMGVGLGVLLTARLLETAMLRYPRPAYLMILGFVLASLAELAPGIPKWKEDGMGGMPVVCAFALAAGFLLLYGFSRRES